ncbi:MAG: lamin tail domain-containing protein, partial [Candidatus Sungbacteria bacterium]|nr:lamin tail domain-containing protein [Candidatus Sungbacteria bacterium]
MSKKIIFDIVAGDNNRILDLSNLKHNKISRSASTAVSAGKKGFSWVMPKIFSIFSILALALSPFPQASFVSNVFAADVSLGDIVINEFASDVPRGDEWVELLNTSDNDVPLSGFKLSELENPQSEIPTEILLLELSGTIPAHGILVFNVSGLNNDGDSIALYNGEITPENLWQRVTYGEVTGYPATAGLATEPEEGESAYLLALPSTWAIAGDTPTKGWFNVAQEFNCDELGGEPPLPPTLISIQDCLEEEGGIISNIGELDNPSATPA